MNIRLQTWFPYHIQICLNGRQWLRRCLEKKQIEFLARGNKFLHVSDYKTAQDLLDAQLDMRFAELLNGFLPTVFPMMEQILGPYLSYYWTMWQSEWATDLMFTSSKDLNPIMDSLLRHAHMNGTSTRVLRYPDRPPTISGRPYARSKDQVVTRVTDFNDGIRLRHWVDNNSVKVYNEQNVLRVETTINDPGKFRVFRHKQGQSCHKLKSRLPLRKGVVDIPLGAIVSQEANNRFMDDLATFSDDSPARNIIDQVTRRLTKNGRRYRALDPTGKDREILQLIADPAFRISGLTNKMLRQHLKNTKIADGCTDKQLSAKISRYLRLLRAHGIIRKLPRQNRYQLTVKGVRLSNLINAFLAASTEKLMKIAA
jgi:predicted transcriptional regulator